MNETEFFPDGTPIDPWFYETSLPTLTDLGKPYPLTEYGILDDGRIHTKKIQSVIDLAAENGGGVVIVPEGTYLTGSLYFKQDVHLYVAQGGTLKGSDDIADYDLTETRIEGENCLYFSALINADGLDGFTIAGPGTIDGNGLRAWRGFWLRRRWNPQCTNKDEQRPRLIYLSECKNVLFAGVTLQNAHFWTTHLYRCSRVKYIGCRITSPAAPVPAPSTDAIDLDVCTDVLIKHCYLATNDDAVVLKGGRGAWADTLPENGSTERILIEDCRFGFCHACITCGSESIHDRNLLARRLQIAGARNFLRCKLRPDTPQIYEYITVENITGEMERFIDINPWTQFFDLKGRTDKPLSLVSHLTMRSCRCRCHHAFAITVDETQYRLAEFVFDALHLTAKEDLQPPAGIENLTVIDCEVSKM